MSRAVPDSLLRPSPDEYWMQTREPLVCLAFLAPLLACYEVGVFWFGGGRPDAIRNGADDWLRSPLQDLGAGGGFLLPLLLAAGLVAWQIGGRYPWRISLETLAGMAAESVLFAVCLLVVGQLQDLAFRQFQPALPLALSSGSAARAVTYLGAGIYEEVMFRLLLLPACYGLFRAAELPRRQAAIVAVIATSIVFSLAHYWGPAGDQFQAFSFTFRTLAGLFFAALFFTRGFGITVGCHAAYDLLVGVLLVPL